MILAKDQLPSQNDNFDSNENSEDYEDPKKIKEKQNNKI
jgi:hypothetical protein